MSRPRVHKIDLAFWPGTNGRALRVRCHCMAGDYNPATFWSYDALNAEPVWSLAEAVEVFQVHLDTGAKLVRRKVSRMACIGPRGRVALDT